MTRFEAVFARAPEVETTAQGRVNLIGEHTDYNEGFVLPTLIPQTTHVALARRTDLSVHLYGESVREKQFEFRLGEERRMGKWGDYVQGLTRFLREAGHELRGFDAHVESGVPIGSGLSSSAALSVSMVRALELAFEISVDALSIAKLCQRVENEFVGARVGIMDPLAVTVGKSGSALFVDTRALEWRHIPLPTEFMDLLVINSGVVHRNAAGEGYNTRRSECERACELLNVRSLRDVDVVMASRVERLPDPYRRRVRHVLSENVRVLDAVKALEAGDLPALGTLFLESHASLRDDYEVSVPEIDFLVERLGGDPRVFGARITGGGFGGSVVALVEKDEAGMVAKRVLDEYARRFGARASVLVAGSSVGND